MVWTKENFHMLIFLFQTWGKQTFGGGGRTLKLHSDAFLIVGKAGLFWQGVTHELADWTLLKRTLSLSLFQELDCTTTEMYPFPGFPMFIPEVSVKTTEENKMYFKWFWYWMSLIVWIITVHWRNSLYVISEYRSEADLFNKLYRIIKPGENLYII